MRKMLDGLYGVTTTAHDDVLIKHSSDGYRLTYTTRIKGDSFMQVTFQSNNYVSLLEPRTNANKSDTCSMSTSRMSSSMFLLIR
jgi:hypothetical protein